MKDSELRKIIKQFNNQVYQTAIDNRDGIQLPESIGWIFIGTCQQSKKQNVDYAKSNKYVDEVMATAKKEGWILNPQWHNPGSQEYIEPDIQDDMLDYIKNN
jgi:hypothetical protein